MNNKQYSLFNNENDLIILNDQDKNQPGIIQEDLDILQQVCQSIPEIEAVVLFGSRALGTNRYNSDFDLVVKGNNVTKNTISLLNEQLEDQLFPYRFDVLHDKKITHQQLINHIKQYGRTIYQRQSHPTSS